MRRTWINTRLEYDAEGRLTRREGYWHEGPVLSAGGVPTLEHTDWAFYNDGTEAGSTIIGTKNVNPAKGDLANDTIYLYRAGVHETAGNSAKNVSLNLSTTRTARVGITSPAPAATSSRLQREISRMGPTPPSA